MQQTAQELTHTLLLIENDPAQRRYTSDIMAKHIPSLPGASPKLIIAKDLTDAQSKINDDIPTIILADLESVSGVGGVEALNRAAPDAKLISLSGQGALSTAIDAMRAGAWDFLTKPFGRATVQKRITEASQAFKRDLKQKEKKSNISLFENSASKRENLPRPETSKPALKPSGFEGFCGSSLVMSALYRQISRVAPSAAPVFITGESGAGKEVCAEALHNQSGRGDKPFVAINCSAIPKDLMESELFGHCKGSFTGAIDDHPGAVEQADGGTLFLDEIGDMDLALQAKLLRFIQTGTVRRVGDIQLREVDVRIVCATHRDPQKAVDQGNFREDLFYRLHVLPISVPPLRLREEDVLELARKFLKEFAAEENRQFTHFTPQSEACLAHYHWPGNVRELQNIIRHTVVMNDGIAIDRDMLPDTLKSSSISEITSLPGQNNIVDYAQSDSGMDKNCLPFWQQEQSIIETALVKYDGNISRAAAALEISPSTIYRKRQSWMEKMARPEQLNTVQSAIVQ
ncbi:MAG: sigma-54 dependent transcriptional regulator [Hyphomicrobiales bacterium]